MFKLHFTGDMTREKFAEHCASTERWYHSYYFDNGYEVGGDYNIGADIEDYGFPKLMRNMRVLDVGAGAGWFAFYFEQLGAEVTAIDARGREDYDVYGKFAYPIPESSGRSPDRFDESGRPVYYNPVSGAFWKMKDALQSKVDFRNLRVYEISKETLDGGDFDLVFMGAILAHLRDPIGALAAVRSICRGQVITTTAIMNEHTSIPGQFLPYIEDENDIWWLPDESCFQKWFTAAGFRDVDVRRQVALRSDRPRYKDGKVDNPTRTLRIGTARV
jgi:2-polyprenyl-3-methyl-5-hydroxy-6-metoxy-1,4-benzoquinol methylase